MRILAKFLISGAMLGSASLAQAEVVAGVDTRHSALDEATTGANLGTADHRALRAGFEASLAGLGAEERAVIEGFFAARDYAPFWTEPDSGRGAALRDAVAASGEHGLPLRRYDPAALAAVLALADDPAERALAEVAATRTYLAYARDLTGGMLTPSEVDAEINIAPDRPTDAALLAGLDAPPPLQETLAALAPSDPDYAALRAEKRRLEALRAAGGWGTIAPDGATLRQGERTARVAPLRARLERLGYRAASKVSAPEPATMSETAPAEDASADEMFDAGLEAAVKAFQRDHGLLEDGAVGARTLAAINASVEDRLEQVLVNLERLRWAADDLGSRYIYVNIADYSVRMIEAGAPVFESRVVVGQNETRTPEFTETMTHMVVNPTWYIPDSIAKRVYLPKLQGDPNVIANSNMRLFTRSGTEINPALVDWRQVSSSGDFPFRVRQNPSTSNALGQVKFMFPNQFAIYLHDTPAKELFDRDARAFSNGCVRVENPFELARRLLAPQLDDPEAELAGWVEAGDERYVNLDEPIPVHLTYRTALVDSDGVVRYRDDVYGRDGRVFDALAELGVVIAAVQG